MLAAPTLLSAEHRLDEFASGTASLDDWLKRRARANQISGASRTYVVAEAGRVVGYYCLASGALALNDAPGGLKRNMPDPVPVMVLGRLAVDRRAQGIKLGAAMLQDAVNRAIAVSRNTGVRALLVHALHEQARQFYAHYGFQESPQHPMTLMLRLHTVKA